MADTIYVRLTVELCGWFEYHEILEMENVPEGETECETEMRNEKYKMQNRDIRCKTEIQDAKQRYKMQIEV